MFCLILRFSGTSQLSRMLRWLLFIWGDYNPCIAASISLSLTFLWGQLFSEFLAVSFPLHSQQTWREFREYFPEIKHEELSDCIRRKILFSLEDQSPPSFQSSSTERLRHARHWAGASGELSIYCSRLSGETDAPLKQVLTRTFGVLKFWETWSFPSK